MDVLVTQCVKIVFFGAGAQIPFLVEVAPEEAVHASHEAEHSDVELPPVDKQWVFDIFLYNYGVVLSRLSLLDLIYFLLDFFLTLCYLYTDSSVGVLSWFDDPNRLWKLCEYRNKLVILGVADPIYQMECHREYARLKNTFSLPFVIFSECMEQALFLRQVMVFVHPIVNFFDSFNSIQLSEELFLVPGCPDNLASLIVLNLTKRVPPSKLQHLPYKWCVVCFSHTKFDQGRWWLLLILDNPTELKYILRVFLTTLASLLAFWRRPINRGPHACLHIGCHGEPLLLLKYFIEYFECFVFKCGSEFVGSEILVVLYL